mgnify:CR=1 FL=1
MRSRAIQLPVKSGCVGGIRISASWSSGTSDQSPRSCGVWRFPEAIHAHECALVAECRTALSAIPGVTLYGPDDSAGIVSFNVDGVHAHDVATILDDAGVAVRAGHHCAQPLMEVLGVDATARASFAAHSDSSDIEALVGGLHQVKRIFG